MTQNRDDFQEKKLSVFCHKNRWSTYKTETLTSRKELVSNIKAIKRAKNNYIQVSTLIQKSSGYFERK